ncbi:MAG TPA: ATP-binding protein [Stellaceae bacterium]|nr:ATP-binding protein [Stellaceae bacterium]
MLRLTLPATVRIDHEILEVPLVLADADELNQVVVNLVTNAAHAIGAATGTVRVSLAPAASGERGALEAGCQWIRLSVADTGCGMDADTVRRIFEPFFTTKEVGQGTGLGLSVVHGIVTDHGGRIDVESERGIGTKFTIYLPTGAIAARDNAVQATTDAAASSGFGTRKVPARLGESAADQRRRRP